MPSSRSATHRAGHASNRSAASTAKTGTSSVLEPESWRAPVTSTISLGAGISAAAARQQRGSGAQFVDGPERVGCAEREPHRHLDERQTRCLCSDRNAVLFRAIRQRTAISCDRDRPLEHPVCQWPPSPRGRCGTIMSSTPSSRRRTTPCFLCIESDGIVGNFSARQQDLSHERVLRRRLQLPVDDRHQLLE
jgi:hypothetical protein